MKYVCKPNDPNRYVLNPRCVHDNGNLIWDHSDGQSALIVQTPFGYRISDYLQELCDTLNRKSAPLKQFDYEELESGIWFRFVTAAEKGQNNGCPLHGGACTYTVFSCNWDDNTCMIYEPVKNDLNPAYLDIPVEMAVQIERVTTQEGILWAKRTVETAYWELTFPTEMAASYTDGNLVYRIGEFEVPVTKKMFEHDGPVYVKSGDTKPVLESKCKGLKLS